MYRIVKRASSLLVALLLLTGAGLYMSRNAILTHYSRKKIEKLEQRYGLKIGYDKLYLPSINQVAIDRLCIIPTQRDTLLKINSLQVNLNLWQLMCLNASVSEVSTEGIEIRFVKKGGIANYDFLFQSKSPKAETSESGSKPNFSRQVSETLNLVFRFLPSNGTISQFTLSHRGDSSYTEIRIPQFHVADNHYSTELTVLEDHTTRHWISQGTLSKAERTIEGEIYSQNQEKVSLPYIDKYYGAKLSFDTLSWQLSENKREGEKTHLSGKAEICGLNLFHKALSPEVIDLNQGQLKFNINVGSDCIELDSTTLVKFNRLSFHPYLQAKKADKWHITTSINKPFFPADELFTSLPKGLFSHLDGIQTSGELAYHFLLDVDFNCPDSLKLESDLKSSQFRINSFGQTDLGKMSKPFTYTAYEGGQPVRSFVIGPENPNFCSIDSISPLLQMSVLQSEDGAFYYHRGFLIDAMREAMIHDLKVRRFARGGSTITMQLVKNVFLNRNKNIARKLEEALIVWLIESQGLTSKQRMFEVYLNIAEWGPLIYGAKEASAYYFRKEPSKLTASEAIFLASIIPKPKHFRNSFEKDMTLKENMEGYYRIITERLQAKGLINGEEAAAIQPDIEITGEAKHDFILSKDSMRVILEQRTDKKKE